MQLQRNQFIGLQLALLHLPWMWVSRAGIRGNNDINVNTREHLPIQPQQLQHQLQFRSLKLQSHVTNWGGQVPWAANEESHKQLQAQSVDRDDDVDAADRLGLGLIHESLIEG